LGKDPKDPLIYGSGSFAALAFGVLDPGLVGKILPGEPPNVGQPYRKLILPVTFDQYKASKVGHTSKSWTFEALKLGGLSFLRLSLRLLGIDHMGPLEQISFSHLPNEEISPFKD
jgi:hypothetical protein